MSYTTSIASNDEGKEVIEMVTISSLHGTLALRSTESDSVPHSLTLDNAFDRGRGYVTFSRSGRSIPLRVTVPADSSAVVAAQSRVQSPSLRQRARRGSFVYERPRRVRTARSQVGVVSPCDDSALSSSAVVQRSSLGALRNPVWGQLAIIVVLMVTLGVLAFTIAQLVGDPAASIPTSLTTISVRTGDTLGSIASHYAPRADTAAVIDRIRDLNELQSAALLPGQVLVVPAGL